ncbi:MAG: hypothetical protein HC769_25505 [Cyanobacteria bacterium CRU_2_1]|nr:hypothetical protein [Cyanobacteria bacterium RU_5_0]NJR61889.1 hypothetical protein [Cyanobacteria bacterium CRU_2_1]
MIETYSLFQPIPPPAIIKPGAIDNLTALYGEQLEALTKHDKLILMLWLLSSLIEDEEIHIEVCKQTNDSNLPVMLEGLWNDSEQDVLSLIGAIATQLQYGTYADRP